MTTRALLAALATAAALAACQKPPAPVTADTAAAAQLRADCRVQMERQYNAQNRVDLTRRDERDFAFAGTYNAGITSRGLGAEYGREQMVDDCLRANGSAAQAQPGFSPASSPSAIGGAQGSSLRP